MFALGVDGFDAALGLHVDLERRLAFPVDVHDFDGLPSDLQFRVLREGIVLVDADRRARVRREVTAQLAYDDFKPYLDRVRQGAVRRLTSVPHVVDADIFTGLFAGGERYLADVRRFRDEAGRERFLADRGEQYKVEFPLQQVIQVAMDLAAHVMADSPGLRPNTLAELFDGLAERSLIDRSLATRLSGMARFRNLLVHRYGDIDPERVWDIVNTSLGDLDELFQDLRHAATVGSA
jgi:uncharacterized protein YutE (UPF0331/DUF86 family)